MFSVCLVLFQTHTIFTTLLVRHLKLIITERNKKFIRTISQGRISRGKVRKTSFLPPQIRVRPHACH